MEKSKVFFTDMRTRGGETLPNKLKRLIRKAGIGEIDFRGPAGLKPPTLPLVAKISESARNTWTPIPDLSAPPDRLVSGK
jgi:hypothetical protein